MHLFKLTSSKKKFEFVSQWYPNFHQVHRSFSKEMKEIRLPTNTKRNFEIEYSHSPQVSLKILHHDNDHIIDIGDLLPKGYTLVADVKFEVSKKEVHFNINELAGRGFLLSLFHEIGHCVAGDTNKRPFTTENIVVSLTAIYHRVLHKILHNKLDFEYEMKNCISLKYLKKTYEEISVMERRAWAYSLISLRNLEKQGWNVFSGFQNQAEIDAYISYSLISYEMDYMFRSIFNLGFHPDTQFKSVAFLKTRNQLRNKYDSILKHEFTQG